MRPTSRPRRGRDRSTSLLIPPNLHRRPVDEREILSDRKLRNDKEPTGFVYPDLGDGNALHFHPKLPNDLAFSGEARSTWSILPGSSQPQDV